MVTTNRTSALSTEATGVRNKLVAQIKLQDDLSEELRSTLAQTLDNAPSPSLVASINAVSTIAKLYQDKYQVTLKGSKAHNLTTWKEK